MKNLALETLKEKFYEKKRNNRHYSLRAFAKQLGVNSGRISEIISGKRGISIAMGKKLANALFSNQKEKEVFLDFVVREKYGLDMNANAQQFLSKQLNTDQFFLISDWQHLAILSLLETDNLKFDINWMAKRLGISKIELESSLERLIRLDLVEQSGHKYILKQNSTLTTTDISNDALKESHRQSIEQAIKKMYETPLELRDISSISMAINPRKIGEAKKIITAFRKKMSKLLESGTKTEVYNLNIQLVPVTITNHKELNQ